MSTRRLARTVAAAIAVFSTLAAAGTAAAPDGCSLFPGTRKTIGGDYRVAVTRCPAAIAVERPTFWTFRVTTRNGKPFGGRIVIAGGMPDHGHGFLTAPVVARMRPGVFRVRLVFAMPGRWVTEVRVGRSRQVVRYVLTV